MSNLTPNIPPAWYPDPAGGPNQRWWDGTQWTEHYQQPYTPTITEYPKAPEGVEVYTPYIWLIVFMPIVSLVALAIIPWGQLFAIDPDDPQSVVTSQLGVFLSPGYLLATLGSIVIYGLSAFFAYLDWKTLGERGIARPFHFAWVFLSSSVYVFGRSVVVGRRTGGKGKAPIFAQIGMYVLSFVVSIVVTIVIFSSMFEFIARVSEYSR